jgi:hypothetical protein
VFLLVSSTAPITGVIFGGFITQKLGGYSDEKARIIAPYVGLLVKK